MTTPRHYTAADVMAVTGLGRNTIWRMVEHGQMPGRKIGRKLVITEGDFQRIVAGEWGEPPKPLVFRKPSNAA